MAKFYSLLCVILMVQVSRACDGHTEEELATTRQYSNDYLTDNYDFIPYTSNALHFQPTTSRLPDYSSLYESRTPVIRPQPNINPFRKYLFKSNVEDEKNQVENRFLFGLFNNRFPSANTWRPFANQPNRFPISFNPNFNNPFVTFDACTSPSGESGICAPGSVCSLFGGRPSGSCTFGKVCCVNTVSTCGGTVTLNNTYWQSPSTGVSASSTCALKVRTDTRVLEQSKKPICQIRLDFISFATAQPIAGTCTDTFTVGGTTTVTPTICGDNSGQHMYLDVPSSNTSPTDVQLIFSFSSEMASRSWNIKISMLPCGATYLAPADCLQYFTAASGRVKSFNWKDVAGTATRQLNNQNYNICFRTELVSSQATELCLSVCAVTNGGDAFSITTPTSTDVGNAAAAVAAAKTDLANAQTALTNAQATLTAAQTTLTDSQTALTAAQDTLTTATNTLTAAQEALATAQAAVPVAQTALTNAQIAQTNAQTALDNAKGTLTTAQATLATAQANLATAEAAASSPPTAAEIAAIDTARTAVTDAQTAVDNAQTAVASAQATFDSAQTDATNAQTAFDNAQTAVNDAQSALGVAQTNVNNAQTAVNDAQTAVLNAQNDVDTKQAAVTNAQTAVTTAQAALTTAQTAFANAVATAGTLSGVGTSAIVNGVNTATCLYDFLLIAGARDSTNVEADRFCGNALNPAITPVATSVPVCTPMKPFKMTYRTDGTEDAVIAGANVLPAPVDSGNVGFCLDYQEK